MSDTAEAVDALLDAINEHQLDGYGPWREVGPQEWERANGRLAAAYVEITLPGGDSEAAHLVADPEDARPVFDPGAAADRARDAAIDRQNGVD